MHLVFLLLCVVVKETLKLVGYEMEQNNVPHVVLRFFLPELAKASKKGPEILV